MTQPRAAIVGIGATPYYKRGQSYPESELSMACSAILMALADAGLTIKDLDGFSIYSSSCDPATVGAELGVPEIRWATTTTSAEATAVTGAVEYTANPLWKGSARLEVRRGTTLIDANEGWDKIANANQVSTAAASVAGAGACVQTAAPSQPGRTRASTTRSCCGAVVSPPATPLGAAWLGRGSTLATMPLLSALSMTGGLNRP